MSVSVFDFFCTCGFTSADGTAAVNHVHTDHMRNDRDKLCDRVLQMIYSVGHDINELCREA